jgi:hypothetical protein
MQNCHSYTVAKIAFLLIQSLRMIAGGLIIWRYDTLWKYNMKLDSFTVVIHTEHTGEGGGWYSYIIGFLVWCTRSERRPIN